MATLMEKDVLLEYAHIGYLLPRVKDTETAQDLAAMAELWNIIMDSDAEHLDFAELVAKIREIKDKYIDKNVQETMVSDIDCAVQSELERVWEHEIMAHSSFAELQENPHGFVLGGQPGAGKAQLTRIAKGRLCSDFIIINGDDFRRYHPEYHKLQEKYGQDAPKQTAEFAGKMTEAIFQKAVREHYNICIEGTFRTAETPIKTLKFLKDNNYQTTVMIQTCHRKISWQSCLERYEKMQKVNPQEARFTAKEHHDLVCSKLAQNIQAVQKSGLVDFLEIYARTPKKNHTFKQSKVYDSVQNISFSARILNGYLYQDVTQ